MKVCLDCGVSEDEQPFYATSPYCVACHNKRMVRDRKKPGRRERTNAYNNGWLKRHPEANRAAQHRWRERQRAERAPWTIPPGRMTVQEAMQRLQLRSRFRVAQLIDQGQLGAIKEHGQWLIDAADVERMAAERGQSAEEKSAEC